MTDWLNRARAEAFRNRARFTTRRPIDPSSPTTSVAGQIAPTIRREDLRPLPTREEQRRQYDQLQQRPRQVEAYQDPRNQFAEAGQYGLEMTGLPSIRRSAGAFADGRPQDGVEEGAMGALSLATLGVGGRGARAQQPRPAPMRAPMPEAPPSGALRLPPSSDPLDVFHGTNRQVEGSLRPGNDGVVWSTTNPEQASYLAARRSPEGANVMPGRVTPDGYEMYDSGGQSLNPMERQRIIDEARARGARGVVFRNDRDGVAGTGDNVASFDGADFAPRAGALRPPPRQLGTASDGSVMPVREPQPFRQSMVGGSDDLAEAARPRSPDGGNGGAGRVTRTGGGGFIEYEASPDGWRITDVQLDPALRGKGNGVALYEQMLEEAAAAGVTRVFSDNIVSQSAEPIYAALRRRGYTVTASPRSAVTRHPNNPRLFLEREDGQPIFTVSTQRARSPTPSRQGEPRPQGTITNDPMGNPPEGLDTTPSVNDPVSVRHARGRRLGFDMDNRVYGGAALDPAELDRVRFGNPESHHGRAEYFTSSTTDLERNYARADGPDLTSNIERRAEQLQWEIEQNPEAFGATADDDLMEVARRVAREQAAIGNEGVSIPAHLRLRNPVITNGVDPTVARRTVSRQPSTRWDYEIQWDDAGDEIISEGGPALDLVEATRMELDALGFSQTDEVVARLMDEVSSGDGITADAFERIMRDEPAAYVIDYEGSPGQIIADVYRRMGHDGVVLRNAERQFANMGMEPDTTHYAVFDQSNVRSPHAAFDPARSNSRDLLAGIAAPVALGGALSQRQRQ